VLPNAQLKGWQKRWFSVDEAGVMNYYSDPMQESFRRAQKDEPILLTKVTTITSNNISSTHFELNLGDKTLELRAPEKDQAVFKTILACFAKLKEIGAITCEIQVAM